MLMEEVKIFFINSVMMNTVSCTAKNHLENIELHYEEITWKYCDGNVMYSDSWNEI